MDMHETVNTAQRQKELYRLLSRFFDRLPLVSRLLTPAINSLSPLPPCFVCVILGIVLFGVSPIRTIIRILRLTRHFSGPLLHS